METSSSVAAGNTHSRILIPVRVTGNQPAQVLGLESSLPRRRRGAAGSL
ncbi:hypothetical protein GOB91_32325 [Sinorhizobium meliloti]|nr:hypothetical protein [Sinorhizobium meliloti]MDW9451988.1 hypothetical protein [Sinorhizobium meliloti]MDW9483714.1 hypothetical protein [Sinorhizobium meliloti]MDW9531979.1 hypothetical protein [Sinorhizobium meliloti]MDW9588438.1 hypothetical protein [Sinorhizobium meliloti]